MKNIPLFAVALLYLGLMLAITAAVTFARVLFKRKPKKKEDKEKL